MELFNTFEKFGIAFTIVAILILSAIATDTHRYRVQVPERTVVASAPHPNRTDKSVVIYNDNTATIGYTSNLGSHVPGYVAQAHEATHVNAVAAVSSIVLLICSVVCLIVYVSEDKNVTQRRYGLAMCLIYAVPFSMLIYSESNNAQTSAAIALVLICVLCFVYFWSSLIEYALYVSANSRRGETVNVWIWFCINWFSCRKGLPIITVCKMCKAYNGELYTSKNLTVHKLREVQ